MDGPSAEEAVSATRAWIEKAVIGLNLCPFAKAVYVKDQIRYTVSEARTSDELLDDLVRALRALIEAPEEEVDTTLLIHPHVFADFLDYNDFLEIAGAALEELDLTGVLQVASFHPQYQFAGTAADDVTNCTNRSPYPMLHILREASVDAAVAAFPDAKAIYRKNMETLRRLGPAGWAALRIEPD